MNDPYLLGFSCLSSMTASRVRRIRKRFNSLQAAWECQRAREFIETSRDENWVPEMLREKTECDLDAELKRIEKANIRLLGQTDAEYPAYLREIHSAPEWLYVSGSIPDQSMIAVVGTRQMSEYARRVTTDIVSALVDANIAIVSGLALGVDGQAHETALQRSGMTVAVLGSGLQYVTPRAHTRLAKKIVDGGGAIVSEFPLNRKPEPFHFPQRNRIISGCTIATVVTGAGERSGALITARFALDQGREVFAVPASMYLGSHRGCNKLITEGATPVVSPETILEELRFAADSKQPHLPTLSDDELLIAKCLSREPIHFDDIVHASGRGAATVGSVLTMLEAKGVIESHGGMRYTKNR